jgi:hypothetical protein
VRAVKASVASGEATNAFFVAEDEFSLEKGDSPLGDRAQTKLFGGGGEKATLSIIANVSVMVVMSGDRDSAKGGSALDVDYLGP